MKLDPHNVTLEYVCNNDDNHEGADDQVIGYQPLSDIVDSGTLTCSQCGDDMGLVGATSEPVVDVDAAERFWIDEAVVEDSAPDIGMPFGDNTVGIVDDELGGVLIYVHKGEAPRVLAAMRATV